MRRKTYSKLVGTERKDCCYHSLFNNECSRRLQHDPIKVRITNFNKRKFASELENQYPVVVRNKLVNGKLTDDDTIKPPFVPSLKTFQNVRNRTNTSKYYHKIVVLALWVMSCTPSLNTVIRNVSLHPFFVYYWTELQRKFYQKFSKSHYTAISIDATGSLFKKIYPPTNLSDQQYHSKHLFLYVTVLKLINTSIPLTQMISATQKMENIYVVKMWAENMIKPKEFITDDFSALIGACVKAFTTFATTREYVSHCFKVLEQQTHVIPVCFMSLDSSHFIKTLYGLECFKFVDLRVKKGSMLLFCYISKK